MSDRLNESLNDLRRVYLDSVAGNYLTEQHEYINYIEEKKKSKLDPVGQEDDDVDNDGDVDDSDSYLKHRRNVVTSEVEDEDDDGNENEDDHKEEDNNKKSHKKKKKLKESLSNWRSDLYEVIGDLESEIEDQRQIKENPKIRNTVKINPTVNIGEQLGAESVDIEEVDINEVIDIASEYFYANGLNESGIDLVIEELGEDQFTEFLFDLAEDYYLFEERAAKKRKPKKSVAELKAEIDTKEKARKKITTDRAEKAVEKAKEKQSSETPAKQSIAGRLMSALKDRATKDTELLRKSVETARNVATRRGAEAAAVYTAARELGRKAEQSPAATRARRMATVAAGRAVQSATPVVKKVPSAVAGAAGAGLGSLRAGKSPAAAAGRAAGTLVRRMRESEDFGNWVNRLIDEGYDISDFTVNELYERYEYLVEKSVSEQQQKLFGLALSVKRGQTPRSEVSAEVLKIVDEMSEAEIRKFAKTKHEGLPKRAEED
jgi:hypothetical protein